MQINSSKYRENKITVNRSRSVPTEFVQCMLSMRGRPCTPYMYAHACARITWIVGYDYKYPGSIFQIKQMDSQSSLLNIISNHKKIVHFLQMYDII